MTSRRLGCLSGSGVIAAALTLCLVSAMTAWRGGVWFSPGALNAQTGAAALGGIASHADSDGRCQLCHGTPWQRGTMSEHCLACHTTIRNEMDDPGSLHGALKRTRINMQCRSCHTEHQGEAASLTQIASTGFPHEALGYSLAGHSQLTDGRDFVCTDCHTVGLSSFDPQTCRSCHRTVNLQYMEAHEADFGSVCLGCHDGVDRYSKDRFDHNNLRFALTGKHVATPCASCHVYARTVSDLQLTPVECGECHQEDDSHEGRFGTDCDACHITEGWKPATFDHATGAFPLTGGHAQVKCTQCHTSNVYQGTPTTCARCHRDPAYHLAAFGTECADCHTAEGWRPALYGRPHPFPLDHGESGISPCRTCHPDAIAIYTCYGCHEHAPSEIRDKHTEERIRDFADCVKCHATGRKEDSESDDRDRDD